ncbi:MAG: hypothetical protein LBV13_02610 [Methanomassiliicoccaceae archaeon]|nr:hypothetical protein [Methanomassiliicoccaceae archaeon]
MVGRPKYVAAASIIALIGAFLTIVVAVSGFDIEEEGLAMKMGLCVLSLILFLAVCGSLNTNGQWTWRFLIFMEVLCTAVPVIGFMLEAIDLLFAAALAILAGLTVVFSVQAETRRWVEADRL